MNIQPASSTSRSASPTPETPTRPGTSARPASPAGLAVPPGSPKSVPTRQAIAFDAPKLPDLGDVAQDIVTRNQKTTSKPIKHMNWATGTKNASEAILAALGDKPDSGRIEAAIASLTAQGDGAATLALPVLFQATSKIANVDDRLRASRKVVAALDAISEPVPRSAAFHSAVHLFEPAPDEAADSIGALAPRFSELQARLPRERMGPYSVGRILGVASDKLPGAYGRAAQNIQDWSDQQPPTWQPAQTLPAGFQPAGSVAALAQFMARDHLHDEVKGQFDTVLKSAETHGADAVMGSLLQLFDQLPTNGDVYRARAFERIEHAPAQFKDGMTARVLDAIDAKPYAAKLDAMKSIADHLKFQPMDHSFNYPRPAPAGTPLPPRAEKFLQKVADLPTADRLAVAAHLERENPEYIGAMPSDAFNAALERRMNQLLTDDRQ